MTKKSFWKIWLRPNPLTKEVDNDYVAEISATGNTLHNEDIARQIVKERSEYRYDTILSILNERDSVEHNAIMRGSSVQTGNVHIAPRVVGGWIGADPVFDPKSHRLTVTVTPTAELRKSLEEVGVEILGKKTDGGAFIGLVTDMLTGKLNGTVTLGGDIILEGSKIKITPANDASVGVFFTDAAGTDTPLDWPIAQNSPKRILCRVPASLTSGGVYTLKIVTRYTHGENVLLKELRTIIYELPIRPV
jgi:hypothetical protein